MKKLYIILFFAVLIIIAGFLFLQPRVQAQTSSAVSGTAEIVNMGYKIYFSGSNGGTSGNIPYNVQYDTSAGKMTGYAWSPEYGWIQFNGSSATALSLQNPNDRESPEWADGIIKLNGTDGGTSGNIPYSVTFDPATGNALNHWAWGGNVIGWIDFSGVKITPTITTPTCSIIPISSTINSGDSVTLYWSSSNTTSCIASNGSGSWAGVNKPTSGTFGATPSTTTTYDMSCLGNDGTNATCSATVTVVPPGYGYNCSDCSTPVAGGQYPSSSACTSGCSVQGYNCSDCSTPVAGGQYPSSSACTAACRKVPHYIEH
jgi:hypothetical protein